jgi:hypothetical protein
MLEARSGPALAGSAEEVMRGRGGILSDEVEKDDVEERV